MQTAIYTYSNQVFQKHAISNLAAADEAQLVLCFGSKQILTNEDVYTLLKNKFKNAAVAICSTAGEIYHTSVMDDTLAVTAIKFNKAAIAAKSVSIHDYSSSYAAGLALANQFEKKNLVNLFVLSDGSSVNGSELISGLNDGAGAGVLVTGGLAGDGGNFKSTLVGLNAAPQNGLIAAIGFYGTHLKVSHGSQGGWDTFGLEKEVTKSDNNVLYEIENSNALEFYKKYLGPEADALPGSALLFPLSVILPGETDAVVRTILSIDEDKGTMTFAGDIPAGSKVRLMKANFDRITNAAAEAAGQTDFSNGTAPALAILISCVGRKLILKSRVEEETEAVDEKFANKTVLTGFYSYGELSPLVKGGSCQLHNQTMTITTFYEAE